MSAYKAILSAAFLCLPVMAQLQPPYGTATRIYSGTILPNTCDPAGGNTSNVFNILVPSAQAGLWLCTAVNTWSAIGTSGGAAWGAITGTLSSQTDLQTALNSKGPGTITSVATTGPITGGTITGTGTIACATCVTSAGALTSNAVVIGGGLQASSAISADTTTTHALFATSGAPAFRAVAAGDIPTLNQNTSGTASNVSGTPTLPNGTAAATQTAADNSTKLATTAYVDTGLGTKQATLTASQKARAIGATFDGGGSALTSGKILYLTVPFACTLSAWNIAADTGTATVDILKVATGTALPTSSITASATPALASNNALHSTTLTGWTTAVSANDILGFKLSAVATATQVNLVLECDQ